MKVELPDEICPKFAQPSYVDYGEFPEPLNGGVRIRIDRPGNKFSVKFDFAPINDPDLARVVLSRLISAKTAGLRIYWPLQGFEPAPTNPIVVGDGQIGTTLKVRNCRPGNDILEGQFLTLRTESNGLKKYTLHKVSADVIVNPAGSFADLYDIELEPPLRYLTVDDEAVSVTKPFYEGYIIDQTQDWAWSIANQLEFSIELEEAA